ncbi:hypothetical protein [Brockia lithotrophica]|uniref:Uncharacterized protein n=1 Tax=Brockia lithotrophica TaxID=933949 RepID=A0A660KU31_9BACL|nr:hypothetical protein [Brockia lithotrophica]RKQ84215.1 hypothetical protein C7438_1393 [Brockia lithotrophica]
MRLVELQIALTRTLYEGVVRSLELQARESVQPYLRERMDARQNEANLTLAASLSGDRGLLPGSAPSRARGAGSGSGLAPYRAGGEGGRKETGGGKREGKHPSPETSEKPSSGRGIGLPPSAGALLDERL